MPNPPASSNGVSFAEALRTARESRSLSQEELAGRAQLSVRAIIYLEAGRGLPRERSVRQLVSALELTGSERTAFQVLSRPSSAPGLVPQLTLVGGTNGSRGSPNEQPRGSTRLEFTLADAARVRIGSALGPLAETALAYCRLQTRATAVTGPRPREVGQPQVTPYDRALASFLWVGPSAGFDFYTSGGRTTTFSAGRDAVLGGADDTLQAEAEFWAQLRTKARGYGLLPTAGDSSVEKSLRSGNLDGWRLVLNRLEDSYTSWIEPSWSSIKDHLAAEEARLAHLAATGGIEALVAGLGHRIRWTGSAVEIPDSTVSGTHASVIPLGGRGLTIVPSAYALRPLTFLPSDQTSPALLIVPAMLAGLAPGAHRSRTRQGEELLGRTRAAVLTHLARGPRTTSELSRDLGIALSGASQHAAVLRRAGLVTTVRDGGHVQHSITELGESLLSRL